MENLICQYCKEEVQKWAVVCKYCWKNPDIEVDKKIKDKKFLMLFLKIFIFIFFAYLIKHNIQKSEEYEKQKNFKNSYNYIFII